MTALSSLLQTNKLNFFSDVDWTNSTALMEVTSASTFVIKGVGGSTAIITNLSDPTSSLDAVNKQYVDNLINGISWKYPVIATETVSNITLTGTQTIGGVAVTAGQRVLLAAQSSAIQNGIYVVSVGAWSRSMDMAIGMIVRGSIVYTEQGSNLSKSYVENGTVSVVGTNSLSFVLFSNASAISPGGVSGQIQYNNAGSFGAADMTFSGGNIDVTSGNFSTSSGIISSGSIIDSTSTTTGAITTTGGLGVALSVVVGGDVQATNFKASSDERLKKNITKIENGLDTIKKIQSYEYYWKDDRMGTELQAGVIAQELEKDFKYMVSENKDKTGYKSVDYLKLIPYLIEAVKELSAKLE